MKILLVEPDYDNKYPPLGLMKLATYHIERNDTVLFEKGMCEKKLDYDYIYITTLFTFDYKITVETINYYANKYNKSNIFIGGILASILTDKLQNDIPKRCKIITNQIESSSILGFDDNVNIDILPPDYNILYQVSHEYTSSNAYLGYSTRGCTNKCSFCAVPTLEKHFKITNNLSNQIFHIKETNFEKKDLLLLDNNILGLSPIQLEIIVNEIKELGYTNNSTFTNISKIESKYKELDYLRNHSVLFKDRINEAYEELRLLIINRKSLTNKNLKKIKESTRLNKSIKLSISRNKKNIINSIKKRKNGVRAKRYIDFNQGMDARFLDEEKIKIISELPIKPFRLAFDHVNQKNKYINGIRLANKYNFKYFSNYLLYNYNDSPKDMYERLEININLADELDVFIHSFPMKYANIKSTNRKNIGEKWNRLYLTNFRRILKPTMGVVGRGRSYFEKAFGKNYEEFLEILSMPAEIITFRDDSKKNGKYYEWKKLFDKLSESQRNEFIQDLCNRNSKTKYKELYLLYYKK